jgi:hypothetical protein
VNSLPVLPFVRALAGGRAPAWWGNEMASRVSSVVRVPAAASWLWRLHGLDLHLLDGPLLGITLEQLLSPSQASPSRGQMAANNPGAALGLNRVPLPARRSLATRSLSTGAQAGRTSDGAGGTVFGEPVASRASIRDLQQWATAPVVSMAAQPRTGSSWKSASPIATSLWRIGSGPQPIAPIRERLTTPALPLKAESKRYWSESMRRRGEVMKDALAAAGASFQPVLRRQDGIAEHAGASVSDPRFVKPIMTSCASGKLLARCLGYERSAARPTSTKHRATNWPSDVSWPPLPRHADGRRDATETPGNEHPTAFFPGRLTEVRESIAFGPAAAERPRANTIWAEPPLEGSDYRITPHSGAQTGTSEAFAAARGDPLTEPVAASRGFEPGRIVAPRLMKGRGLRYGTAQIQSQSEPGEESLVVLAEQIKKILDEEARRHGIPV